MTMIKKKRTFTPEQLQIRRDRSKLWYQNNKNRHKLYKTETKNKQTEYARKIDTNESQTLKDRYVVGIIRKTTGIDNKTIREHPEFIATYREYLKTKRLIKQKKHENT